MPPILTLLRLLLLLLMPLWLSLAADRLGLRLSLPSVVSEWRRPASQLTDNPTLAPPAGWQEEAYLAANPDVAIAVRRGQLSSGYAHYVEFGRAEGRTGGLPTDRRPEHRPVTVAVAPIAADALPPPPKATPPASVPALEAPGALPAIKPTPAPLASTAPVALAPTTIQRVLRIRTAHSGTGVRVVLDFDQPPHVRAAVQQPDGRLMVPLPGTRWQAPPSGSLFPSALQYSAEQKGEEVRLLFGVSRGGKRTIGLVGISTMPPDKSRGHRLVIDLSLPAAALP